MDDFDGLKVGFRRGDSLVIHELDTLFTIQTESKVLLDASRNYLTCDATHAFTALYHLAPCRGAERTKRTKVTHSFEEIGFSLTVWSQQQVEAWMKLNSLSL
jgi:hypothetical protein